jgi:hypothetical protein
LKLSSQIICRVALSAAQRASFIASLPYSAVNNRNRFILDVAAFERALGGDA